MMWKRWRTRFTGVKSVGACRKRNVYQTDSRPSAVLTRHPTASFFFFFFSNVTPLFIHRRLPFTSDGVGAVVPDDGGGHHFCFTEKWGCRIFFFSFALPLFYSKLFFMVCLFTLKRSSKKKKKRASVFVFFPVMCITFSTMMMKVSFCSRSAFISGCYSYAAPRLSLLFFLSLFLSFHMYVWS